MRFELVGVPYTSMAEPGGIVRSIGVLRSAGLAEQLRAAGDVEDRGDLDLIEGSGQRGGSGLLNEAALARLIVATREAVTGAHDRHRIPLLIGGDCPVLLGALAALRDRHGSAALVMVDGHEDAWPPRFSPTGEASDSEVGLALGHFDATLPEAVDRLLPLLEADGTAILGPRDRREIEEQGVASLEGVVAFFCDDEALKSDPVTSTREAAEAIRRVSPAFWLHLDLDVLATDQLAAIDYPQPGGLGWNELSVVAETALGSSGCAGASIVIYNPDRDRGRQGARRIVKFAADLVEAAGS